jgi:hypothetical protein
LIAVFAILLSFAFSPNLASAEEPQLVVSGETKTLVLPQEFTRYLSINYSNYRLPISADISSVWETVGNKLDGLPYITWGDYNGDGLTDIALFLLGNQSEWQFVVFLKKGNTYEVGLVNGTPEMSYAPQVVYLSTIKKGGLLKYNATNEETGKDVSYEYSFPVDVVRYQVALELPIEIYYWEGAKLEEVFFGME